MRTTARRLLGFLLALFVGLGSVAPAWAKDITVMSSKLTSRVSPPEGLYLSPPPFLLLSLRQQPIKGKPLSRCCRTLDSLPPP